MFPNNHVCLALAFQRGSFAGTLLRVGAAHSAKPNLGAPASLVSLENPSRSTGHPCFRLFDRFHRKQIPSGHGSGRNQGARNTFAPRATFFRPLPVPEFFLRALRRPTPDARLPRLCSSSCVEILAADAAMAPATCAQDIEARARKQGKKLGCGNGPLANCFQLFGGFSGIDFPKSESLKIQPNSSQGRGEICQTKGCVTLLWDPLRIPPTKAHTFLERLRSSW